MKLCTSLALGFAIVASAAWGCGTSADKATGWGPGDGGSGGVGDDAGGTFMPGAGGDAGADGSISPQSALTITPTAPTVTVTTGQAVPTVAFTAYVGGVQTAVGWSIDRGELGAISPAGVFTPAGTIAGTGNVTATYGAQTATTTVTVKILTTQYGDPAWSATPPDAGAGGYGGVGGDGPGASPSAAQVAALGGASDAGAPLDAGASLDPSVSILYPYTGTVWPQGLLAPLLQWSSGAHSFDSVYVDLSEKNYEYKGYFAANKTPFTNLPIPQAAWDAAGFSNGGAGDSLTLTLVFGDGGAAYGPYTETWVIAQATMKGTIYYNSYGTSLVTNSDTSDSYGQQYGAATLAIPPGATAPVLVAGVNSPPANPPTGVGANQPENGTGCRVCHTVSANGKSLVTQASNANAGDYSRTVFLDLAMDTTGGAGTSLATANLAFPALYKDGSLLFSSAGGMINGDDQNGHSSTLYALPAGTPVAGVTGLPAGIDAALPAFSPDGTHVSFNFWSGSFAADAGASNGDKASLAMLDFDGTSAFSNPRVLYTPASGTSVTYSSFEPDSSAIIFEIELSNPSGQWAYTWNHNTSELWWLDVKSGTAHPLDSLNGYGPAGAIYLPDMPVPEGGTPTHTAAQDVTLNYEPTVNPIASGGYAWVVFTSRRMYGNVAQLDPWTSDPRDYPWHDQITDKKLWVAAVDLDAPPGTDPSHPAFYLPAQELHAGNSRGYWTVEACLANGMTCQTGDQCCGGYCQAGDGGLVCSSQKPACSSLYDKCTTTSDCCGAGQGVVCIDDICSVTQPPPAQ